MKYRRDPVVAELLRAVADTLIPPAEQPHVCTCDDCRLARAHDITPGGEREPELGVSVKDLERIRSLAKGLGWNHGDMEAFTVGLFGKRTLLLTMREARAVIAHLEEERVIL